ncbi:hypothetical protein [Methanopyrus sp.]
MIRDGYRFRLLLLISGVSVFSTSTYLSYLYPTPTCDWFYYGFIAKYYSEHGDYPKVSWWRKDEPQFIYRSPIIPLCSLVINPKGGPKSDYRFLIALAFGFLGSILSFLIEPRMGSVIPWILTTTYTIHYSYFLGGKRTICLLTYPVFGTLLAKSLVVGKISRSEIALATCLGAITGLFYDGWLETLPLAVLFVLIPDVSPDRRKTFLIVWKAFVIGAAITIAIPDPNISASHGLLVYHNPGLISKLLGIVSEWRPPGNFEMAAVLWYMLIVSPVISGMLTERHSLKLKLVSVAYTSAGLVVKRLGPPYLIVTSPLWYEKRCAVSMAIFSLVIFSLALKFSVEPSKEFWEKYPDWKFMKPVVLKNLKHGRPWGEEDPPFEAWLYYEVDKVPARVTPYDMDWRGYEPPLTSRKRE